MSTSAASKEGFVNKSSSPSKGGTPSMSETPGANTSASTSSTVLSNSMAMLIAKLIDKKLLPSPGKELVTMIRLAFLSGRVAPLR
jgi:hypothetical protein